MLPLSFFQAQRYWIKLITPVILRHLSIDASLLWKVTIKSYNFFNYSVNSSSKSDCHAPLCSGTTPTACTEECGVVGPRAPGTQEGLCRWSNTAVFLSICFLSACKKILAISSPSTLPCLLVFLLFLLKIILHGISIQVSSLLVNVKHICPV